MAIAMTKVTMKTEGSCDSDSEKTYFDKRRYKERLRRIVNHKRRETNALNFKEATFSCIRDTIFCVRVFGL